MLPPTERWDVQASLVRLAGGHRNLAFRTLGLRQDVVFKSTCRTAEQLAWLRPVQDIARACGFVVPGLRESRDGRLAEEGWTCEPFIAGAPVLPGDLAALVPQIRAFHAASADLPQRPGFLSVRALLDRTAGGDVDLTALPAPFAARCRAAWQAVADREEAAVHGDLNPGNLILCPDGRTALIDWDECRRDLALFDLGALRPGDDDERMARLAWEVACSWQAEPEHGRRLAQRL
ncbi:phosphotransferase [Neotabrizicola sp. VNH66]|uniref:phosphotransferase n=1 Tax=Neotabrizicola sp. VNH66 TaxID=3400918 RepID=UPI003C0C4362